MCRPVTVCPLPYFCDADSPVNEPCSFLLNTRLGASSSLTSCYFLLLSQLLTVQIPRRESDWSSIAFGVKMGFVICLLIGCLLSGLLQSAVASI